MNSSVANIWNTLEGEVIDGKYHLSRLIASGGFGGVFEADEVVADQLIRHVAIKFISPNDELAGRQIQELALAASLDHNGLIRSFSPGQCIVQNIVLFYIVMELATDSLGKRLENGPVDDATARAISEATLGALVYLTEREDPLVHRDVKPDNILLVGTRWKLGDFGLLRGIGPDRIAKTGNLLGTAEYAPPEAFQGVVSPAWDVWSFGVMLVEMLTGSLPFEAETPQALQAAIIQGAASHIDRLPEPFRTLAEGCLRPKRESRVTAEQAIEILRGKASLPPEARPDVVESAPRASAERKSTFPFRFKYGSAETISELIHLCEDYPLEAQDYLVGNYFHKWLRDGLNDAALAHEASGVAQFHSGDPYNGLELILRSLRRSVGMPALPQVTLIPERLDFGMVTVGARVLKSIRYDTKGHGHIWGSVASENPMPGLTFAHHFVADGSPIPVTLDTIETPPGLYQGAILVWPYGFEQPLRLPVSYTVAPIRALVSPARIDLGSIEHGESRAGVVTVRSPDGAARLSGSARIIPPSPGITVTEKFQGAASEIVVNVDTAALESDREYVRRVQIECNGGRFEVPLRFAVALKTRAILLYTLAGAAAGAAGLGLIRWLLGEVVGDTKIWALTLDFADTYEGACRIIGTPLLAFATGWLFRLFCRWRWPLLFEAQTGRGGGQREADGIDQHTADEKRRIDLREL